MPSQRPIDLIVIHCSASPNGHWHTAADIDAWHRERGFRRAREAVEQFNKHLPAIGYHWLIYTNGVRAPGRHYGEVGAHAREHRANFRSLGVCVIGTDRFASVQWIKLAEHVRFLSTQFGVPLRHAEQANGYTGVCGHRDLGAPKACPGFSVADWLAGGLVAPAAHLLEEAP